MKNQAPIFLINLDRSVERLNECEKHFKSANLTYERIPAVYGADLTPDEISQHFSKEVNKNTYYRELTPGEIGCFYSHRKAWQKIVDEEIPYAIILEDDFSVIGDVAQAFETLNKMPFDWDYIKLAGYKTYQRKLAYSQPFNGMELTVFQKPMTGACGQAVSLKGAKQLLRSTEKFGRPVDTELQHFWEKGIEIYTLLPYVFAPDQELESEIGRIAAVSAPVKKHFWRRKMQQLRSYFKNKSATAKLIKQCKIHFQS